MSLYEVSVLHNPNYCLYWSIKTSEYVSDGNSRRPFKDMPTVFDINTLRVGCKYTVCFCNQPLKCWKQSRYIFDGRTISTCIISWKRLNNAFAQTALTPDEWLLWKKEQRAKKSRNIFIMGWHHPATACVQHSDISVFTDVCKRNLYCIAY